MAMRRAATSFGNQLRSQSGIKNVAQGFVESTGATGEGFIAPFGVRHASRQILQQRMRSVGNIAKITAAMKMVAASRLRLATARAQESRGMWQPMVKLLGDAPDADVPKNLVVPVTSDRGLCGGINSGIAKTTLSAQAVLGEMTTAENKSISLAVIGEKGRTQMRKALGDKYERVIVDATKIPLTFNAAGLIADDLLKTEFDAARIIYNKFKSAISFQPTLATVLSAEVYEKRCEATGCVDEYEMEGEDRSALLVDMAEFQLCAVLYNGMLENSASELGSRMSAMDSSTKNANEMLSKLTLTYNRSRQAAITTELIEIISGAAALEG